MMDTHALLSPDQELPAHPDDEKWAFVMVVGDQRIVADTATELLSVVIEGYENAADEVQAFTLRFDHAVVTARTYQDLYLTSFSSSEHAGDFFTNDALLSAVMSPKYDAVNPEWIPQDGWSGQQLPVLVVVSTLYAPYQPHVVPAGDNILVLDPYSEINYLRSLSTSGQFELYEAV